MRDYTGSLRNLEYPLYIPDNALSEINSSMEDVVLSEIRLIFSDLSRNDDTEALRVVNFVGNLRAEFKPFPIRKIAGFRTMKEVKRGDPEEILEWFNKMPKDEEFAKLLDEIVEKMRREMKLG
jgi:hypothetical protein